MRTEEHERRRSRILEEENLPTQRVLRKQDYTCPSWAKQRFDRELSVLVQSNWRNLTMRGLECTRTPTDPCRASLWIRFSIEINSDPLWSNERARSRRNNAAGGTRTRARNSHEKDGGQRDHEWTQSRRHRNVDPPPFLSTMCLFFSSTSREPRNLRGPPPRILLSPTRPESCTTTIPSRSWCTPRLHRRQINRDADFSLPPNLALVTVS